MGVYTLFQQQTSAALTADTAAYTLGVQFSVSHAGTLNAIWFFSGTGATDLPSNIVLFQVSGQSLVASQAASWSGAAGSGWVRAPFSSPPQLSAGVAYKACVFHSTAVNWYSAISGYWTTGAGANGITSGSLSAPNNANGSPGQDSFLNSGVIGYPGSSGNGANYQVDPEVTVTAGGSCDDYFGSRRMLT